MECYDSQKISGFVYENISDDDEMETKPFQVLNSTTNDSLTMKTGTEAVTPMNLPQFNTSVAPSANIYNIAHIPVQISKKETDCEQSSKDSEKTVDVCWSILPTLSDVDSANECNLALQNVCLPEPQSSSLSDGTTEEVSPMIKAYGESPARKKRRKKNKTHARVTPKKSKKKRQSESFVFEIANDTEEADYVFVGGDGTETGESRVNATENILESNCNVFDEQSVKLANLGKSAESNKLQSTLPFEIAPQRKRGRPLKTATKTATASTSSISADNEDSYTSVSEQDQQRIIGFRVADINTQSPTECESTGHLSMPPKNYKSNSKPALKQIKVEQDTSFSRDNNQELTSSSLAKSKGIHGRQKKLRRKKHRIGRPPVIGNFKCDRCDLVFQERPKLIKHRKTHVMPFIYCSYCDFKARSRGSFLEHESKHTKAKPFKCELCPYASRSRIDLQRHQAKHSKVKNYKCPYCDFTTKWRRNVSSHLLSHVDDRPFHCEICGHSFKRSCDLKYHIYRHTSLKPLSCEECDFRCKTNYELNLHKFKHSDVRSFPCTHPGCQQACKTKSDLSKHMHVHSEERKFPCPLCGKCFKSPSARNKHTQRHTTERPFKCDICEKTFKVKSSLGKHMQLHNGIRPFSCEVCGRTFASKSNKQAHMVTHDLTNRPYRCPLCPYGGRSQQNLLAHVGTMHGNYAFFCELCKKPYKRHSQLQLHYKRMHTKKEIEKLKSLDKLDMTLIKGEIDEDEDTSENQTGLNHLMKQIKQEGNSDEDTNASQSYTESSEMKSESPLAAREQQHNPERKRRGRPRKKAKTNLTSSKKSGKKQNIDNGIAVETTDKEPQKKKRGRPKKNHHGEKQGTDLRDPKCVRHCTLNNHSGQRGKDSYGEHSEDIRGHIGNVTENSEDKQPSNDIQIEDSTETTQNGPSNGYQSGRLAEDIERGQSVDVFQVEQSTGKWRSEQSTEDVQSERTTEKNQNNKQSQKRGRGRPKKNRRSEKQVTVESDSTDNGQKGSDSRQNFKTEHLTDLSQCGRSLDSGTSIINGRSGHRDKDSQSEQSVGSDSQMGNTTEKGGQSSDKSQTDHSTKMNDDGQSAGYRQMEISAEKGNSRQSADEHSTENSQSERLADDSEHLQSVDICQSQLLTENIQSELSGDSDQRGHTIDIYQSGPSLNKGQSEQSRSRVDKDTGISRHLEDKGIDTQKTDNGQRRHSVDNCNGVHSTGNFPSGQSVVILEDNSSSGNIKENRSHRHLEDTKDDTTEMHEGINEMEYCVQDKALGDTINAQLSSVASNAVKEPSVEENDPMPSGNAENEIRSDDQADCEDSGVDRQRNCFEEKDPKEDTIKISKDEENVTVTSCVFLMSEDTQLQSIKEEYRQEQQKSGDEEDNLVSNPDHSCHDNKDQQKNDIQIDCDTLGMEANQPLQSEENEDEIMQSASPQIGADQVSLGQTGGNTRIDHSDASKNTQNPENQDPESGELPAKQNLSFVRDATSHSTWTRFDDNFRLPLATKGFRFNFQKSGKKPKCWFMDLDAMHDEAKRRQLQYLRRKSSMMSAVQRQRKMRQASLSTHMRRKKKLLSTDRMKGNNKSPRKHTEGTTLAKKNFHGESRETTEPRNCGKFSEVGPARRQYTSKLDGEKVSKEDLFKLNKSEGTMLKPKLAIVSDEVSESCMQKVKGISMTSRRLPFKKKYIKLEVGLDGHCINPKENYPIEKATDKNVSVRKETGHKGVTQKGGVNTENESRDDKALGDRAGKQKETINEAFNRKDRVTGTKKNKHDHGVKHEKRTIKKKAILRKTTMRKPGIKRTNTKECEVPVVKRGPGRPLRRKKSEINADSLKKKPNITDVKMQTEGSVLLKLQEKIKQRQVRNKAKTRCSDKNKKTQQCPVCMRDLLFGKDNVDRSLENVTCPFCELDLQFSSEFEKNRAKNRYEKIDLGSDSDESEDGKLFSKNVYVVMPPADKEVIQTVVKRSNVYIKPKVGHVKTYVVSKEINKAVSYELTNTRQNVGEGFSDEITKSLQVTEDVGRISSVRNNEGDAIKIVPCSAPYESQVSTDIKPNLESLDIQVHVSSQGNHVTIPQLETVTTNTSNFDITRGYPHVKKEIDRQCQNEVGGGEDNVVFHHYPLHIRTNETSECLEQNIIDDDENAKLRYSYLCTGSLQEVNSNSNDNNVGTSDSITNPVTIKAGTSKEVCVEWDNENQKVYVYSDDVAVMRSTTGQENQGQNDGMWSDPCVKTVMEDLGNDTMLINGQAENIAVANYLGCEVKKEKEDINSEIPDLVEDPVIHSSKDGLLSVVQEAEMDTATVVVLTDVKPLPVYHLSESGVQQNEKIVQDLGPEPNLVQDNTNIAGEDATTSGLPIILDVRSIKHEPIDF
ncbi:uncharacterized protein LOC132553272 [Ylistrum balloti]|uniref:uncharacterized protein LOC132553272 n=1 Tax=Ylistrum balloti TaxID=509963 RepID=UPI002905C835|nr:uncharacterized protein LOC132553272 [Ylistrum balloti]